MPPPTNDGIAKCEKANIAVNDQLVSIDIATIHAVKGETHSATILLECFDDVHDLKEVLPIIVNRHDANRLRRTKSIEPAVRRTFVGMTRPRCLVAFAVRKSHIEDYLGDFTDAGWKIIDLTEMAI
jgi:superfamily I DNA/RNA helicase